jgi:hypothetical protein
MDLVPMPVPLMYHLPSVHRSMSGAKSDIYREETVKAFELSRLEAI